jgi:hypothetical protein
VRQFTTRKGKRSMLHRLHELSAHLSRALLRRRRPISFEVELTGPILIRYSREADQFALERLAALDSRALPKGPFLLAEIDGELAAAAPLDLSAEPLSDPFLPTANLRDLVKVRVRHVRRNRGAPLAPSEGRPSLSDTSALSGERPELSQAARRSRLMGG